MVPEDVGEIALQVIEDEVPGDALGGLARGGAEAGAEFLGAGDVDGGIDEGGAVAEGDEPAVFSLSLWRMKRAAAA
ncbi:MAG: hypothetical protein QM760_07430 [Nibricoccus sp.]